MYFALCVCVWVAKSLCVTVCACLRQWVAVLGGGYSGIGANFKVFVVVVPSQHISTAQRAGLATRTSMHFLHTDRHPCLPACKHTLSLPLAVEHTHTHTQSEHRHGPQGTGLISGLCEFRKVFNRGQCAALGVGWISPSPSAPSASLCALLLLLWQRTPRHRNILGGLIFFCNILL